MGRSRADRLAREHGLEIEYKPFEIHPETPAEGTTARRPGTDEARMKAVTDHLMQQAALDGLEFSRPELRANSHLSMMADAFARDAGMQEPFHTNMLNAYWQEHRNIGLREVVLDVAGKSGLDVAELEKAFDEGRYEQEMADIYDECNRYGITGVPTFLIGRYMVVGAQPYEILEKALTLASQEE